MSAAITYLTCITSTDNWNDTSNNINSFDDIINGVYNDNDINLVEFTKDVPRKCIKCDGPKCNRRNPRHRCSKCHSNYYCSIKCQKNDWMNHKQYCISINDMKKKHEQIIVNRNECIDHKDLLDIKNNIIFKNDIDHSYQKDVINDKCAICLEKPMKNPTYIKECHHGFCSSCILQWQQYSKLKADLIVYITPKQQQQYQHEKLHDYFTQRQVQQQEKPHNYFNWAKATFANLKGPKRKQQQKKQKKQRQKK